MRASRSSETRHRARPRPAVSRRHLGRRRRRDAGARRRRGPAGVRDRDGDVHRPHGQLRRCSARWTSAGSSSIWNPPVVRADIVVFHNPSCLQVRRPARPAHQLPAGLRRHPREFPAARTARRASTWRRCLRLIDAALVCRAPLLAPVSALQPPHVEAWARGPARLAGRRLRLARTSATSRCAPPTAAPRDRRGRHSRPGFEKFPPLETMLAHFPAARRELRHPRRRHLPARPRRRCRRTGSCCASARSRSASFLAGDRLLRLLHPSALARELRPGHRRGDRRRQARHHRPRHRRDVRRRGRRVATAATSTRSSRASSREPRRYGEFVARGAGATGAASGPSRSAAQHPAQHRARRGAADAAL